MGALLGTIGTFIVFCIGLACVISFVNAVVRDTM